MYDDASLSAVKQLHNTRVESPRFGPAFHARADLAVQGAMVQPRGGRVFVWIYVGS